MNKFILKRYEYFIGIDPSLTGTGICIIDRNCKLLSSSLIATKAKDTIEVRYSVIIENIKTIDNLHSSIIAIEGIGFGCRGQGMFQLAGLHYVIRYFLWKRKIKFMIVPPTTLKKFVTGKGNSKKELMLKTVYKKWGMDFDDNNVCDAYGLARYAWEKYNEK